MMTESLFEKVKSTVDITQVVQSFGVKLDRNDKARCPFHRESDPSFSIKRSDNIFKCFGCGAGGDAIDFVAKIKDIEQIKAARLLAEMYHIDIDGNISKHKKNETKEYIMSCIKDVGKTDYFNKRGLNDDTIKKYSLGYDIKRQAVVIPYSSKLDYYQTRGIKDKTFFKPKTEDAGPEPLFNGKILYSKSKEPVFIVESPICALSIMQCGNAAIALCGINGASKVIKECKTKRPTTTLILSLDNDEPGQTAQQELANQLVELGIKFDTCNISSDCKDPNELLIKDEKQLKANIEKAKSAVKKKYTTDKNSISAYELQTARLLEPYWVIKEMLPEGLAIICAPSKSGKSWMMLQMCLAVCEGKEFMGFKTNKADCLYYALEDSKIRLKDRMNKMLGVNIAPKNLHLAIKADPLDGGLLELIKEELEEHADIKLVIIDTLQKIRGKANRAETTYTSDYREMSALKEFADKNKICILLVHHLRKMVDESDVFNMISGSNGIMGACDTIFIISKKKRKDEDATLSMTGRDIPQSELVVHFETSKYQWEVIGTAEEEEYKRAQREYENNPVIMAIKSVVNSNPLGWQGNATDIIKAAYDVTGKSIAESATAIGKLISEYETKLYYDGIEHKTARTGSKRIHKFWKQKKYLPYSQDNFIENDD